MKLIALTICSAILLLSCTDNKTSDTTTNADTSATKMDTMTKKVDTSSTTAAAAAPMDSAAMMKSWQAYMTPGQVHAMLAKSNGTWKEDVTMWMSPGAPPTKSTSSVVNKMVLGGRYQEAHHTGTFNGMPFEGISMIGYDNMKKVFQSSWVDNFGTGISNMEGTWDSTSKTINFKGKMMDPMTGKEMEERQLFTIIDDNHQKVEMFANQNGKEVKTMEIALTRSGK